MLTAEGNRICDYEYRNRAGTWCACRKPAGFRVASKVVPHMELDYCARHAPRTEQTEVLSFQRGSVFSENGRLVFRSNTRRDDENPSYRAAMHDAGRGHLLR